MTDEQIIELFWERREEAIRQAELVYGKRLQNLAFSVLRDQQEASEVVNDTLLRAWVSIPPNRPQFLFAYLAAICRNLALNRVDWRNAAKRRAEIVTISEELAFCLPDPAGERTETAQELSQALNGFLSTLEKETRIIFLRRYWYADSVSAIARQRGISESKVKMQLLRTRNRLREYLEKEGIQL